MSQLKFPLEVSQGHIQVLHRHLGRSVTQQLHQGRKANTGTQHFRCIGVSQLVRDDAGGKAERMADLM